MSGEFAVEKKEFIGVGKTHTCLLLIYKENGDRVSSFGHIILPNGIVDQFISLFEK